MSNHFPAVVNRFRFAYISTALIIFLTISMSQAFIQFGLIPQEIQARNEASLIGKQRGRVLQMIGDVLGMELYPTYAEKLQADIRAIEPQWESVQQASIQGNTQLGITPQDFPTDVQQKIVSTEADFLAMRSIFATILSNPAGSQPYEQDLRLLIPHAFPYSTTYQTIYTELSNNADQEIYNVQHLEIFLYGMSVVILLAEGFLVVWPAIKKLAETFAAIEEVAQKSTPAPVTPALKLIPGSALKRGKRSPGLISLEPPKTTLPPSLP